MTDLIPLRPCLHNHSLPYSIVALSNMRGVDELPNLSQNEKDIIIGFAEERGRGIINSIEGCIGGGGTSYTHNGFMVYHQTINGQMTFFYSYDNVNPNTATNVTLLGIGHHRDHDRSGRVYQLERGYVYGGRNARSVDIGGSRSEWSADL